jgi:hypothetical protein
VVSLFDNDFAAPPNLIHHVSDVADQFGFPNVNDSHTLMIAIRENSIKTACAV